MNSEKMREKDMEFINEMKLCFQARSENESFARVAVAAFLTYINPTIEEIEDIKTAVSEAVTNAIIHGYEEDEKEIVYVSAVLYKGQEDYVLKIIIEDTGKGIADIQKAMEPMFTTKPELERSGMGFAFMEAFMDEVEVESEVMKGTSVVLTKRLGKYEEEAYEG